MTSAILLSRMYFLPMKGLLLMIVITHALGKQKDQVDTYDKLYQSGSLAYNNGNWFDCAKFMTAAVTDYKNYRNVLIDCRVNCRQLSQTSIDHSMHSDLAFYDTTLRLSDCTRRCKLEHLGSRSEQIDVKITDDFKNLEPYNYIQLCAYKLKKYKDAVSAAFTYMVAHPEDQQMKNNMAFYKSIPGVREDYYIDLEAKEHQDKYEEAASLYKEAQFTDVINVMEKAVRLYYEEAKRCDAACEEPYNHHGQPEMVNAIADHYIHVLSCRTQCPTKMATIRGHVVPNYLAEHYNYLQFSYYKAGKVAKACEAAATFLLLEPTNTEMLENRLFFLALEGVTENSFVPTQEAAMHVERRLLEAVQFNYVSASYTFAEGYLDPKRLQKVRKYEPGVTPLTFRGRDATYAEVMRRHLATGINISLEGEALQGLHRVVVDNFISIQQADQLVQLANLAATQGDGYKVQQGKSSPHTEYEKFEGITIMMAARMAEFDLVPEELARLYLTVSDKMRVFLEDYWNLATPLFFHYTHLVCRTALEEEPGYDCSKDSQDETLCIDPPKSSDQNAVSAVLYLNQEFEGGKFFFAHQNLSVQQLVEPQTSRMVGFEAGNYHGVQAVTTGKRCALALWFTLSELEAEKAHREAIAILSHKAFMKTMKNSALLTMVKEDHIRIVKTEVDLNGPERFAADQVVSKEDCQTLIKLANTGGLRGDGYRVSGSRTGKTALSPHTSHEMFEGLTVIRAAQLVAEGKVEVKPVELYLQVAERGRKLVETYFNLKSKLYFDFTHLVCRTALHDEATERTDLSHPVHSDNCILQPDGSCKKERPAYIQRDYSSITYLNGEFKGGEIFFTHQNLTVQSSLKPHEGMLVGFQAANLHGVTAVEAGQRCAIAQWYTLDPDFDETSHILAHKMLSDLRAKQSSIQDPKEEL